MPKVSGSSIATPEGGPTPGSAPIRMPTSTPATAIMQVERRERHREAEPRLARKSIASASGNGTRSQWTNTSQLKPAARERDRQRHPPAMPAQIPDQHDEEQRGAEDHADDLEQRDEGDGGAEHHQHVAQALAARQPGVAGILSA